MTDKVLLASKMTQPASSGPQGPRGTSDRGARNETRGQKSRHSGARNHERNPVGPVSPEEETRPQRTGQRNTKKGRIMNDLVSFQSYRPAPAEYNHRRTRRAAPNFHKEDYVTVSCQFVVEEGDWRELTQVDTSVSWTDVVQVRLPCEELSSCPICLFPPVCPLSPVCGHAMCYVCALRFGDACPGGDCPICHKPLILDDFRPLKTYPREKFGVGEEIVLSLVSRRKGDKIVTPAGEQKPVFQVPNISDEWGSRFSSVVTASPEQILQAVFRCQEEELKTQMCLLEDDKELEPYIVRALAEVAKQTSSCFEKIETHQKMPKKKVDSEQTHPEKLITFYQSSDGQPIFMHPLNSRCLIHEYGSIEQCPPNLECKILALEFHTQSPDTRNRYRYFSHLPLGCSYTICEVDITPLISESTYGNFKSELERRVRSRATKERRENLYTENLSKKLAEKEVTYHCSAYLPKYTEVSKPSGEHYKTAANYDLLAGTPTASSPDQYTPLSFAEKLRAGASKSTPWTKAADRYRINSTSSEISVEGGEGAAPSFQHSFSASLNDAFASLDLSTPPVALPPASGRGRKKKGKGKTISLTGGARRG